MLYERETGGTVSEIVERVKEAAAAHQFGVLGTIDLRAKMAEKGVDFDSDCVVVEVCNPRQAKHVLEENLALATVLPCRIAVYEFQDEIVVATIQPTSLVELFGAGDALTGLAAEVEDALAAIIDEACE